MKLIIDIPEDRYKDVIEARKHHLLDSYAQAVANGIPIPDNATNGDVVKTLFSDTLDNFCERTTWKWNSWWNEPYQKGGTNEKQM